MNEEFLSETMEASSLEDKAEILHRYAQKLGFEDIFYSRVMQVDTETPLAQENIWTIRKGNEAWASLYEKSKFQAVDWAIEHALSAFAPFRLDMPPVKLTKRQEEFTRIAEEHNRCNGVALPLRGPLGLGAGFSASGFERRPTDLEIAQIIAAAQFFDLMVNSALAETRSAEYNLTQREIELLRLLVSGRSMAQIAGIVGSTEQWIRKSFLQMRRKMQAGSNSELVYRAVSLRVIH